jgi:hypothetical protein
LKIKDCIAHGVVIEAERIADENFHSTVDKMRHLLREDVKARLAACQTRDEIYQILELGARTALLFERIQDDPNLQYNQILEEQSCLRVLERTRDLLAVSYMSALIEVRIQPDFQLEELKAALQNPIDRLVEKGGAPKTVVAPQIAQISNSQVGTEVRRQQQKQQEKETEHQLELNMEKKLQCHKLNRCTDRKRQASGDPVEGFNQFLFHIRGSMETSPFVSMDKGLAEALQTETSGVAFDSSTLRLFDSRLFLSKNFLITREEADKDPQPSLLGGEAKTPRYVLAVFDASTDRLSGLLVLDDEELGECRSLTSHNREDRRFCLMSVKTGEALPVKDLRISPTEMAILGQNSDWQMLRLQLRVLGGELEELTSKQDLALLDQWILKLDPAAQEILREVILLKTPLFGSEILRRSPGLRLLFTMNRPSGG